MTVAATPYKESYAGNGVTTVFSVPFYFLADTDLVVSDVNNTTGVITPLVLNVDYTVTGTGTPTGGAVTVTTATATGHTLTIERSLVEDQPTHFVDGDPLPASGLEQALDRIVMLYQQAKTALDRAAKFAVGSPSSSDLPEPQEGYVLGWVSGKIKNLSAATAQLAADLLSTAVGKGAALISYLAPYTGAVGTTQQEHNSRAVNLFDFMTPAQRVDAATRIGSIDSTAAWAAAYAASPQVDVPDGVYKVTTLPNFIAFGTRIIGKGRPKIFVTGGGHGIMCDMGTSAGSQQFKIWIENLTVVGTSVSTKAGLYLRGVHHSSFNDVKVINFDYALNELWCVCNTFTAFECGGFLREVTDPVWVAPTYGIVIDQVVGFGASTESVFIQTVLENLVNGVNLIYANNCRFYGGTVEGCTGTGFKIGGGSSANVVTMDLESNGLDIDCSGIGNTFLNSISLVQANITGGRHNSLSGGFYQNINVDIAAFGTALMNTVYSLAGVGGSLTNNSGSTTIINVSNYQTGSFVDSIVGSNFGVRNLIGGNPTISVDGAAGTGRYFAFETNDLARWSMLAGATAETGANAGSDFELDACDDTGAAIDAVIKIIRAAGGKMSLNRPIHTGSMPTYGTNALAIAGGLVVGDLFQDGSGNVKIVI